MTDAREWYLPDRKNSLEVLGPFSTEQLIARLRAGMTRPDEFVWGRHFSELKWRRIYELEELRPNLLDAPKIQPPKRSKGIVPGMLPARPVVSSAAPQASQQAPVAQASKPAPSTGPGAGSSPSPSIAERELDAVQRVVQSAFEISGYYGKQNLYRRFPRAQLLTEVIVHNHRRYRRGHSVDISENGLFVSLSELDVFEKGEEVIVTVRNAPLVGTFSAPCAVVRVITDGDYRGFGLSFLRLNPKVRNLISRYVLTELAAVAEKKDRARKEEPAA